MHRTLKCDHIFIGKLLSSTLLTYLLWCCLTFDFTQFVILENLSILDLALSGVKGLIHQKTESKLVACIVMKLNQTYFGILWPQTHNGRILGSFDCPALLVSLSLASKAHDQATAVDRRLSNKFSF